MAFPTRRAVSTLLCCCCASLAWVAQAGAVTVTVVAEDASAGDALPSNSALTSPAKTFDNAPADTALSPPSRVPEPASPALLLTGLLMIGTFLRTRK